MQVWRLLGAGAALWAFAGVAVGAFGAHGLAGAQAKAWAATAGQYLMVHGVAVLAIVALAGAGATHAHDRKRRDGLALAGVLLLAGAGIFGAVLTWLALGGPRGLGAVAPVGGVTMLAGWALLAVVLLRAKVPPPQS